MLQEQLKNTTDPAERRRLLEDNADHIDEGTYIKVLDEEEIYERREKLADDSIKLQQLTEEKKAMVDEFKIKMDPVKASMNSLLQMLRTGQEERKGKTYHFANYEAGEMEIYDEDGNLIRRRILKPDERQTNVFALTGKSAAANDR